MIIFFMIAIHPVSCFKHYILKLYLQEKNISFLQKIIVADNFIQVFIFFGISTGL